MKISPSICSLLLVLLIPACEQSVVPDTLDAYSDYAEDEIDVVVHSFNAGYYDFYHSYYERNDVDKALSEGSDHVRWNIQGDGIGLFTGRASSSRRMVRD